MNQHKYTLRDILISFVIIISFLQRVIVQYIPLFSYYDEMIMAVLIILYLFFTLKKHAISKKDLSIWGIILLIIIVGLIGNMISGYKRNIVIVLNGIIVWFKSFIVYLTLDSILSREGRSTEVVINSIYLFARIFVLVAFIGLIISPITGAGVELLKTRMRYGFHPYKFIYSQPALLSWYCLATMMILTIANVSKYRKNNIIYRLMLTVVWLATLRSRAFVYVLVYWFLYYVLFIFDKKKLPKIKLRFLIFVGIVAIVVAGSAIERYFFSGNTTRSILLITGISIAIRFFPFGAGIANYATSASFKNYSSLYYDYGFNMIYRLNQSEDGMTELTDCYWPAVMGELGIIGLIFLMILFYKLGKILLSKSRFNKWIYYNTVFLIVTSLFSSVATAVFSSDAMILYILITCFGIYMGDSEL